MLASRTQTQPSRTAPEGFHQLQAWLTDLGYQLNPLQLRPHDAEAWGLEEEVPEQLQPWYLGHLPQDGDFLLLLAWWQQPPRDPQGQPLALSAWLRRWAQRLWRRERSLRGLLLAATPDFQEVALALPFPEGRPDRPGLRLIAWQRQPCGVDQERLARLAPTPEDQDADALTERLRADLDLRHISQGFLQTLRSLQQRLAKALLQAHTPTLDATLALELAQTLLGRALFLGFLQKKGLLDGRHDYLRQQTRQLMEQGGGLWDKLLAPLFFEVLNTPLEERSPQARRLGQIPYLNGGLFEPTALERRCGPLRLPDALLAQLLEELLGRYALTTTEDAGTGLDPELLGVVFEALMASAHRSASGTFFTPRPLVREVVRQSMEQLLLRCGVPEVATCALLEERRAVPLPPALAAEALQRLDRVALLDPACGSGAFLLEALAWLERLHLRLARLGSVIWPQGVALRRRIIGRNLYGVDLQRGAVRLCELRLWLSIVDITPAGQPMEPLPNLDARVVQGDALLEPLDWSEVAQDLVQLQHHGQDLEDLKARYATATAQEKRHLRAALEESHRALMLQLLQRRRQRLLLRLSHLTQAARAPDLLGQPRGASPQEHKEAQQLQAELLHLRQQHSALLQEASAPAFSPWVSFAEVMHQGGFDAILMNPPWVRLHGIPADTRARLRRRYQVLRRGAWTAGGMLRHLGGFIGQVDLSACFLERALELLAPGGALAALVPSKLARALYGGGVRRLLMSQATPLWLREVEEGAFHGATTYPMALLARKGPPSPSATARVCLDSQDPGRLVALWRLRLEATDLGSPWLLSTLERAAPTARCQGPRLGDHDALQARRGVITGHNQAFLRPQDGCPPGDSVPVLRGCDLRAWRWTQRQRLLWPHQRLGAIPPLEQLPPALSQALEPYQDKLQRRSGLGPRDPWWRLLRTGPHLMTHKVAWRDISTRLEAVALPARVQDHGQSAPLVPLNTVYYLPVRSREEALVLAALFNAGPVRALAAQLCERASKGYLHFFAWVICMLPLPPALAMALRSPSHWQQAMERCAELRQLLRLSQALHLARGATDAQQEQLDALVLQLYQATEQP